MMATARLLEGGADVTLFERNEKLGWKLGITGKGRCNLTNRCSFDEFLSHIKSNPRFLWSSLRRFSPEDTIAYFEERGVPLKTERGNRVFPVSDKAADIVAALREQVKGHTVTARVSALSAENGRINGVKVGEKILPFDAVLLATGGLSYPRTGSTGDGYRMAREMGHTVTALTPSLVPIESPDGFCAEMSGLSLRNVAISVKDAGGKELYADFGEMMFTHFGVTGPMILSASAELSDPQGRGFSLVIDLKPALDEKTLDARILADFEKNRNKNFENSLGGLLPAAMIPVVVRRTGIPPEKKVHSVTKEERAALGFLLKHFSVRLSRFRPIAEAIVTKGGVSVSEVDPKTMESKKVKGLYFAGEILDVDGRTGGFNLQIAFSTAVAAADAMADAAETE